MARFVLTYQGGAMPETPEEGEQVMAAWMSWFGTLGDAVVDGGAPFGPSATIAADGSTSEGGRAALTGYSIVEAADLAAATSMGTGCPILASGGTVDIYESMPIG